MDRLNALEAKVRTLEERNKALADELDLSTTRLSSAEAKGDAYLAYTGVKHGNILLGLAKVPFGLEANNSDNYNTFIERGMLTNAFGNAGAERRIGLQVAYQRDDVTSAGAISGDNEQITRATPAAGSLRAPDESIGANARVTWEPASEPGSIVHVGALGFSVTGEYGRMYLDRPVGLSDERFDGGYIDGGYIYDSWFITGESRPFKNGNFDRVKPNSNFSDKGGTGAFEPAARYDTLDVGSTPVVARAGNQAKSYSAALNWYLTPNFKLYFNQLHVLDDDTPLDPVGNKTKADVFATRLHVDW